MKITKTITRRNLLLGMAAALPISQAIVACGGSQTPTKPSGPVDLTVWVSPSATEAGSPDPATWELAKQVKQKLSINLKVTLLPSGADGTAKLTTAAAANNLPDLLQAPGSTDLLLKWINQGLLAPVNDLLPLMPNRTKDRYQHADLNKLFTISGKQYVLTEANPLNKRTGVFIRKDWLDKLGLQMPKTLDDLLNVAKAFTENDPDGNGQKDTYGFGAFIEDMVPFGIGLGLRFSFIYGAYGLPSPWNHNDPKKITLSVRDPKFYDATVFVKRLIDAKVIDPDWTTLKKDDFRARWKQGKYGIIPEDFAAASTQANYKPFDENFPNGQFVLLDALKASSSSTTKSYLGASSNVGYQLIVSKKAVDAGKSEAIGKFLDWIESGEGYYLASFGKEGVNYKKDAQGNITTDGVPEPYTKDPGRVAVQIRNMSLNNNPSELKLRYPAFKTKSGRTQDPMAIYNGIASQPWLDVTSEYAIKPASNQTDINRYVNENLVQFVTGQKALDANSWQAFIQGLNGLGVSDWEQAATATLKDRGFLK